MSGNANNSRLVLVQVVVFSLIAVAVVGYASINLFDLRLFDKPYSVTVDLEAGGGLFAGSNVTYRGVQIGQVSNVTLKQTGVSAQLSIEHGQQIPRNATATVTRLSAVGEQYLNFTSAVVGGPYLHAGSVVPVAQTVLPPVTATVLANLDKLASGLNPHDISTLGSQLAIAFGGTGPDLGAIADSSASLVSQLDASSPALAHIVANSNKILATLSAHSGDIVGAAASATQWSAVLEKETPTITSLIPTAARSAQLTQDLTSLIAPAFSQVLTSLSTFASLQAPYLGAWSALISAVTRFEQTLPLTIYNGTLHARAVFAYTQPVCSYVNQMTSPLSGIASPLRNVTCSHIPAGTLVRGAQNAPK